MPYGYSDEQWAMLPAEVKQAIMETTPTTPPPSPGPEAGPITLGDPAMDAYAQRLNAAFNFWAETGIDPFFPAIDPTGGNAQSISDALTFAQETGINPFIPSLPPGLELSDFPAYSQVQDFYSALSTDTGEGGGFISELPPGATGPSKATFSPIDITFANAPEWWQALAPDVYNPISEYQTFANLLIPLLSPEDQYTVATNLYQSDPEAFRHLNPELIERSPAATEITPELRRTFFTGERAQKALDAFDRLLQISGKEADDLGPGYDFLRGLADTVRDFGLTSGAGQLTETQQGQLLSALDPLLAQTKQGPLAAFGPLARSFVNPFFSAGSLTGMVKNQFGDMIRPPNPRYF